MKSQNLLKFQSTSNNCQLSIVNCFVFLRRKNIKQFNNVNLTL